MANQYPSWSTEELEQLTKEFPLKGARELSREMGRSYYSVMSKGNRLGLKFIPKIDRVNFSFIKNLVLQGCKVAEIVDRLQISKVIIWKVCQREDFSIRNTRKAMYFTNKSNTGKKNYLLRQIEEYGLGELYSQCCICGWKEAVIDYAHILPERDKGAFIIDNIIPLCPNHHRLFDEGRLTGEELDKIKRFQSMAARGRRRRR